MMVSGGTRWDEIGCSMNVWNLFQIWMKPVPVYTGLKCFWKQKNNELLLKMSGGKGGRVCGFRRLALASQKMLCMETFNTLS